MRARAGSAVRALIVLLILLAGAPVNAAAPPVEVTGATYAEYQTRSGVWVLRGAPVVVTRGATRVEAREIRYAEKNALVTANGAVVVRHETLTLRAARAEGRLRDNVVMAQGQVVTTVRREDGDVTLAADRVEAHLAPRRVVATGSPVLTQRDTALRAERLEYDDRARTVTAVGGVELFLPEGRLTAGRLEAHLPEERAQARDAVRVITRDLVAEAPQATLDRRAGVATLRGGVVVRRGADTLTAAQITVHLQTQRVVATGGPRLILGESGK